MERLKEEGRKYDTTVLCYDHLPATSRKEYLWESAAPLISPGGMLVIIGKSSDMHPLSKGAEPFILQFSHKHRGNRILVFEYKGN